MTEWRSGEFDRTRISSFFHPFLPAHAADSLEQIDLKKLWDAGKRLILVDVDNTLVQWKGEQFAPPVLDWLERAKAMGFDLCLVSNTKRLDRLSRLEKILAIPTVRGRFKPSRAMFRLALAKFRRKADEAIMIGDQLFTDILGANRTGIDAIWVRKMEAKEFGPTAFNRWMERRLTGTLYKALVLPESHVPLDPARPTAAENTTVQQIARFLVVGVASFVIDTLVTYLLMKWIHLGGEPMGIVFGRWLLMRFPSVFGFANAADSAAAPIFGGIASFFAMLNSFVWNRLWTFEARGKDRKAAQAARFYAVSIIGSILNALLFSAIYNQLPHQARLSLAAAKVLAAFLAAFWNFFGQRYYAFRPRKTHE